MGIGTFGTFTQARSAIYAAQAGITVSGNNISNINTTGYTRQRLDQGSLYTAGSDRYYSQGDVRIGQGVLVRSISQIRSPYLDIRYRAESAKVGYNDAKLDGLNQVASILDEVGKGDATKEEDGFGVLGLEFSKIFDALDQLTDQTGHQEYDSTVKQTCDSLATMLNRYANKLQEVYDNTVTQLHQDVDEINSLLTRIRNYNEEIRKCDIHGDNALELRDERNVAIDELSQLVGIRVHYSMEEFSPGVEVEKLSIYLDNANPDGAVETDSSLLVDGIYSAQLILEQVPQPNPAAEYDPDNRDTWPYLHKDTGKPTSAASQAARDYVLNTDPDTKDEFPFLNDKGEAVKTEEEAAYTLRANPNYKPYLKADGTPTADPEEARQVDSPNFNITVSELRSKAGRLLYVNSTAPEEKIEDAAEIEKAAAALKGSGTTTEPRATDYEGIDDIIITTYREELLKNPPYMTERDANGNPSGEPTFQNTGIPNPTYYEYVKEETLADGTKRKVYSSTQLAGMKKNEDDYLGRYLKAPLEEGDDLDAIKAKACEAKDAQRTYYKTVTTRTASTPIELDDNDLTGQIQAHRELLTEGGEFTDRDVISTATTTGPYRNTDEDAGTKRGIVYYQRRLDLLANQFATLLNEANQGYRMDPDGNYITYGTDVQGKTVGVPVTVEYEVPNEDGSGTVKKSITLNKDTDWDSLDPEAQAAMGPATSVKEYLAQNKKDATGAEIKDENGKPVSNGIFDGGVLFSNNGSGNDTTNITAKNISISYQWQNSENLVVRSFTCPPGDTEPASGQPDNIQHIKYLVDGEKHDFVPSDLDSTGVTKNASGDIMFTGTFCEFWNNIDSVLGHDQELTGKLLDTAYQEALEIDTSRDSISAVDFNDEAMNLMMYAKSYNAACRLMTVIDSVLDKLVNNTGLIT